MKKRDENSACPIDRDLLAILVRRDVVTTDPDVADECCGMPRDADGFCQHRPEHPIYVRLISTDDEAMRILSDQGLPEECIYYRCPRSAFLVATFDDEGVQADWPICAHHWNEFTIEHLVENKKNVYIRRIRE